MQKIVTNSTVDGILAAFFAVLIIVVILDASRIWIKAIRAREPLPTTEVPPEPATIVAPAGLFWTDEDRALLAEAGGSRQRAPRRPLRARAGGGRDAIMTLREAYAGVRWYLREVSGESAYDRYVEHLRRDHPDQPVMSRRDFERRRMRMRDENPKARCC